MVKRWRIKSLRNW